MSPWILIVIFTYGYASTSATVTVASEKDCLRVYQEIVDSGLRATGRCVRTGFYDASKK